MSTIASDSIPHNLLRYQFAPLQSDINGKVYVSEYLLYHDLLNPQRVLRHGGERTHKPSSAHLSDRFLHRDTAPDYLLLPFVLGLVLVGLVLMRFGRWLSELLQGMLYGVMSRTLADTSSMPIMRLTVYLEITLSLFVALITTHTMTRFGMLPQSHTVELLCFATLLCIFLVYRLYIALLQGGIGLVVYDKQVIAEARFSGMLPVRLSMVLLLPLAFLAYYGHHTLSNIAYFIEILLFMLVLLFRWVRIALLFLRHGVPFLYFVLYLCALDIAPMLVIIKLLLSHGQGIT